ncbi:MAG: PhnD/SsuA/transferrin family substrate-binding protein [Bryobacterales bacterium]|nr:PhnD/SsuA/transferrin family substrate-binding protein [Bryobacterales bacterium]
MAIIVVVGLVLLSASSVAHAQGPQRLAVPIEGGFAETNQRWTPLVKYLESAISGANFTLSPLAADEISKAIRRGEVEFAIVPPAKVPLLLKDAGVSVLATASIPAIGDSRVSMVPGSILVLKDRGDLQSATSLKDKRIIALGNSSLSGWIGPLGLLLAAGIDPEIDFADLRFATDTATVLDALNAGMIDAAILSNADLLAAVRNGRAKPDTYRVLLAKSSEAMDAAVTRGSTDALPLDAFLRTRAVDDALARKVAEALYQLEPSRPAAQAASWALPANYTGVQTALRSAGSPWSAELEPEAAPSALSQWPTFISLLIAFIASLAAFRLYTLMRSKVKAAKETVDEAQQHLAASQEALARASQMRASLLANFRQDFRTPLTAVLEISRLIGTTHLSSAQVEYVNAIRETTHNLMGSIGNVTDFANLETGALQIESRDFDLMEVIDTSLQNVYEQMGEHHAELSVQVDVNVPRALVGDPARIRQVLQNLLHNAMKFTHSGDVLLHVSLIREDAGAGAVTFTVIDTGIGIDKKQMKTIFEPYAIQLKGKEEGRGLGLPLCKLLVSRMGGEISAESTPGTGTQVSFSLLLKKQTHALALRDDDVSRIKTSRVLLIGGSEISRRIQKYYLQSWGAQVVYSPRFEDALDVMKQEIAADRRFDVVLSPAFVGERNAVELVATVRDHPEFDGIPFVAIASRQECEALPQLEQLAGVLILPRPVRRGDLVIKLTDALRMEVPDRLWKDPSDYDTEEIRKLDFEFTDSNIRRGLVLVADSNSIHQRAVGLVLERMGYEVEATASGTEALNLMKRRRFDLAFVDTKLHGMDSFSAVSELREHENKAQRTPIVGMLPSMKDGEREHCLLSGMDDCILKPLEMETIVRTMRRWTRKAQKPVVREDAMMRREMSA